MSPLSADERLTAHLREIFGDRLRMVAAFGAEPGTCVVIDSLTADDLERCARAIGGKNPPLLIVASELARSLDAFPLEFQAIVATRRLIAGDDLFAQATIAADDVRRACEVQARAHLLHLREGFIESAAEKKAVARLVSASTIPFRALLANVARLDGTTADELTTRLGLSGETFADVLAAAERLVEYVDRWKTS